MQVLRNDEMSKKQWNIMKHDEILESDDTNDDQLCKS